MTLAIVVLALTPERADAYIGPGAGFAVGGSFLAVFAAAFSAFVMIVSWPIRLVWRMVFRRQPPNPPKFQRVVVLGLDGLDFGLTQKMLAEGKLPHLAALQNAGCFLPLASTLPPISPVAWSTFSTGMNPGKTRIYDFLRRNPKTYYPDFSTVTVQRGRFALGFLPTRAPKVTNNRKGTTFWA